MNHSIEKIQLPSGEVRHELRIWNRGRGAPQFKRRFETKGAALDKLDELSSEELEHNSDLSKPFGPEYYHWRKINDPEFAPGWKANLDSYWLEAKDDLEACRLDKLETAISTLKEKWKDLSQKTINNKMGFIHAVLNFSVESKRIPLNPLGVYKKPKRQTTDIEFWERHEAEDYLNFLSERYPRGHNCRWHYSAAFTVLNTGIRAGELWGLKPQDLKPSLNSIRLSRQFNRVSKELAPLKGKKARSVPMNAELEAELLFIKNRETVFQMDGGPVDHDSFHDLFDQDVKAWGGRRITFHGLRHTFATLSLLSGLDIKSLQEIMGHEDISTTMKYVHAVGDSARRAARTINVRPKSNVLKLADLG